MNLKRAIALACVASTALGATVAHADDWTDKWIVRGGFSTVDPKGRNLQLTPTTDLTVDKKTSFTFDVTYLLTERWGVELLAAYPFEHDIDLRTNGRRTAFGSVKHLPPTLSLQYHLNPNGKFRPYVGVGVNYTLFSSEEPDGLSLDDSFGMAIGGGIDYMIGRHALLNFSIKHIDIDADAKLNGADIGTVAIDPMVYGINFGWRFGHANAMPVAAVAPVVAAPAPAPPPPPPPPAPKDSDGDGVTDDKDACPDTPRGTRVGPMGCPCDLTVQLQFKFNSAELTDDDKKILTESAENLRRLNWISGVAEGHTDSTGPEAFNQQLSERRAQSVIDFLGSQGIGAARIRAVGFGESKPIADNATREGRAENRRVVLRRTDCDEAK
jgi:outer membrane protein W/outer membrane protein OmpA-like peptidoglycan-associated protein